MESLRSCYFCRLCLCTGRDLIDVFDPSNRTSTTAIDLIQEFLQFKVIKESTLQWMVCQSCMCCLQEFHRFKARCIRSKLVLSGMLGLEGTSAIFAPSPNHQLKEVEKLKFEEDKMKLLGPSHPEIRLISEGEVGTLPNDGRKIVESLSYDSNNVEGATDSEVESVVEFCWCPDCGVEFLNHLELKAHLEWCRGRGQPFWSSLDEDNKIEEMVVDESSQGNILPLFDPNICCGRCKKVFKTKDHLIRHINKHDFKCQPKVSKKSPFEAEVVGIGDEDPKPSETIHHSLSHEERTALQNGMKIECKPKVRKKPKSFNEQMKVKYSMGKQRRGVLMEHVCNKKSTYVKQNANEPLLRLPYKDPLHVPQKIPSNITSPLSASFLSGNMNCDRCSMEFANKDVMNAHLFSCPADNNDNFGRIQLKKSAGTLCRAQKHHLIAEMKFGSIKSVKSASAEGYDAKEVYDVSSEMVLNESLLSAGEFVSYNCDYCTKPHTTKLDLRNHIVKCHLSVNPQKCNVCHKLFTTCEELEEHSVMHPKGKKFYCTICEESFSSQKGLKGHMKGNHGGNKSYICNLCFNGFSSMSDIGMHHTLVHSESEKPFKCTKCGKRYVNMGNFKIHVRVCQLKTLSYQCHICGSYQMTSSNLNNHLIHHTGEKNFPCSMCPLRFSRSGHRNMHVRRRHLKFRPHVCGICHKQFSTKGDVNMHYISHSNYRPHSCTKCSKTFKRKYSLRLHMLRIHVST